MNCPRCGEPLPPSGTSHTCRAQRPPLGWAIAGWALVTLAVGYGLATLVQIVLVAATSRKITSERGFLRPNDFDQMVTAAKLVDDMVLALLVGLLVALFVWHSMSGGLVRRNGGDSRLMLRHWAFRVWSMTLVLSIFVGFAGTIGFDGTAEAALRVLRYLEMRYVVRLVAIAFLVVAVVLVSGRIRKFVADPTKPYLVKRGTTADPGAAGGATPAVSAPAAPDPAAARRPRPPTEDEDLWGWEPNPRRR